MSNRFGGHGSTGGTRYPKCICGHSRSKHVWKWYDAAYTKGALRECRVKDCVCLVYDENESTIGGAA